MKLFFIPYVPFHPLSPQGTIINHYTITAGFSRFRSVRDFSSLTFLRNIQSFLFDLNQGFSWIKPYIFGAAFRIWELPGFLRPHSHFTAATRCSRGKQGNILNERSCLVGDIVDVKIISRPPSPAPLIRLAHVQNKDSRSPQENKHAEHHDKTRLWKSMMNLIQAITTPASITRAPRRARTKTYTPPSGELRSGH